MQYFVLLTALCASTLITPAASAQSPFYIEAYSLTNKYIELKDLNNDGDILAVMELADAHGSSETVSTPALLRQDGTAMVNLYPVGVANISSVLVESLSEIRDDGGLFVAGTAIMSDGFWRAALWNVAADGSFSFRTMPNIVLPPDSSAPGEQRKSYGLAVNRSGILVGSGDSYLAGLATIWHPPYANAVRYLLSTGSSFSEIDDSGLLAANGVEFDHGNANNRYAAAVMVEGGIPNEVPILELPPATLWPNEIRSMRGSWVAGEARLREATRAFAWKSGTAISINLPNPPDVLPKDTDFSQALSINSSGHAVGYFNGGSHSTRPILWHFDGQKHHPYFLSDLTVGNPYPDYRTEYAIEINDQHHIAFAARDWSGIILKLYRPLTNGFVELVNQNPSAEEENGNIKVRVKLYRPFGNRKPISVNFETRNDTAIAGVDYIAKSGTITWFPGDLAEKVISVAMIDDATMKLPRSFTLHLTGAVGADLAPAREIACWVNDAYQQFTPRNQLAVGWNYGCAVRQGQPQVVVKFDRTGGTDGAITFTNFQATGFNTQADVDFLLPPDLSLSWAAGELATKAITIPLLNTNTPITESKTFTISAEGTYAGSEMTAGLYATIIIAASDFEAPPAVDTSMLERMPDSFSFTVDALQGALLELETSINGLDSWVPAAEALSEDGEVHFSPSLSRTNSSGFFRIKVK